MRNKSDNTTQIEARRNPRLRRTMGTSNEWILPQRRDAEVMSLCKLFYFLKIDVSYILSITTTLTLLRTAALLAATLISVTARLLLLLRSLVHVFTGCTPG